MPVVELNEEMLLEEAVALLRSIKQESKSKVNPSNFAEWLSNELWYLGKLSVGKHQDWLVEGFVNKHWNTWSVEYQLQGV